jgi:hypothetical protein
MVRAMRYPRLYKSFEEFERMELRTPNSDLRPGEFFQEVLEEPYVDDFYEDDEDDEDY